MLRQSRRFEGPIGKLAMAVNANQPSLAQQLLRQAQDWYLMWYEQAGLAELLNLAANSREGVPGGYRPFLSWLKKRPKSDDISGHAAWVKSVLQDFK